MIQWWVVIQCLLVLACVAALVWCSVLAWQLRALRRGAAERVDPLVRDFQALCASARTMGDRVAALERLTRTLAERQTQVEMQAPGTEQFKHAIALVQRGAGAAELVSACGLAEGEAQLICLLHGAERASPGAARNA